MKILFKHLENCKAAEEAVKTVVIIFNFHTILKMVEARDRWTLTDLGDAAKQASKSIGKILRWLG